MVEWIKYYKNVNMTYPYKVEKMLRKKIKVIAAASVLSLGLLAPGTAMWVTGAETGAEEDIFLEVEAPELQTEDVQAGESESDPQTETGSEAELTAETDTGIETEASPETEAEADSETAETETEPETEALVDAGGTVSAPEEVQETEISTDTDDEALEAAEKTGACSDIESAALVVREGMKNRMNTVTLSYIYEGTLSQSGAESIGRKIYNAAIEHTGVPDEGDYLKWHRAVAQQVSARDLVTDGTFTSFTLVFTFEYTSNLDEEEAVNKAAAEVMETLALDQYETDYEKVYAIYDYICSNVVYWEYTAAESAYYILSHSAYAAFVNNEAVCQGYALMFYRLALTAGIDNRLVSGYAEDTGVAHGWNIVKIGDRYYNVDTTWDAGKETYDFFLLGSERFEDTNHIIHSNYTTETFEEAYPMGETYVFANGEAHTHLVSGWTSDGSGMEDTHHSWCYLCGETEETEPHTWDEGQIITFRLNDGETLEEAAEELLGAGEDDEEVREVTARVYTCEKCGEMNIEEISSEEITPEENDPEDTGETESEETQTDAEETEEETEIEIAPDSPDPTLGPPPADPEDDEPILLEEKVPRELPKTQAPANKPVDTSDPTAFGADMFLMITMFGVMIICLPLMRKTRKL